MPYAPRFIVETALSHGVTVPSLPSLDPVVRTTHTGMLEHPSFLELIALTGAETLHFDQCMTLNDRINPREENVFAHLMCNHTPGTHMHPSMIGMGDDGAARSSQWENYSPDMNLRLASPVA